jgi:ribonucleoside-diphosphate reductase alpha chain
VDDYGVSVLGVKGKLASEVSAGEHIAVLTTAQKYMDSAVSKTVNMDGRTMKWEDFKGLYDMAYDGGAKGCTTFNVAGMRSALLVDAAQGESCAIDPETGRRDCA